MPLLAVPMISILIPLHRGIELGFGSFAYSLSRSRDFESKELWRTNEYMIKVRIYLKSNGTVGFWLFGHSTVGFWLSGHSTVGVWLFGHSPSGMEHQQLNVYVLA